MESSGLLLRVVFYTELAIFTQVLLSHAGILHNVAEGRPPVEPVSCTSHTCQISNANNVWPDHGPPCTAARVVYPTTESEIVSVVASAVQAKQKIKVVSKFAHSIPKLVCPGGSQGLLISTRDYNRKLIVNKEAMTAVVDSGMGLRQMLDSIAGYGLALRLAPTWEGVSIAGLISTGTHGSSLQGKGGAIHEYVIGMRLVVPASQAEGYAKVLELTEANEELSAAKVSLGVLGVISKVTFQLEPMFKRSIAFQSMSDEDLIDRVLPFASEHEFVEILWHPAQQRAVYRVDDRASVDVPGDGVFDFVGFRPYTPAVLSIIRTNENLLQLGDDVAGMCITSRAQTAAIEAVGFGLKKDEESGFNGYPVVGYQHRMQTSGACLNTPIDDNRLCSWDSRVNGLFYFETSLRIPASRIREFIQDVEALRDEVRQGFCGIDFYEGIVLRYVKASSAYLGNPEDTVAMDMTYYRTREAGRPRVMEAVMEEVEQMATFKYGGIPHWAKNRVVAFDNVAAKYPNVHRFLAVKDRWDPDGLFSSEWSDYVLGLASLQPASLYESPGCALEGLCICSSDLHCAPEQGYLCQPGRVYKEARVCRK